MLRLLLLLCMLVVIGCGHHEAPVAKKKQLSRQEMIDRPTPLREEIDEVAPIRDQVLRNSGR